jgi:hypothetical protein
MGGGPLGGEADGCVSHDSHLAPARDTPQANDACDVNAVNLAPERHET